VVEKRAGITVLRNIKKCLVCCKNETTDERDRGEARVYYAIHDMSGTYLLTAIIIILITVILLLLLLLLLLISQVRNEI
jgi:hypothetical protein